MKDYREVVSAICLVAFFVMVIFACGYGLGRLSVKPEIVELEQSYHSGPMPYNTPVWAVYEHDGQLIAFSAKLTDDEVLLPFAIRGIKVAFDPMDKPIAWTTLTAGILEVIK